MTNNQFSPGDKVECINNTDYEGKLTNGKVYTVEEIQDNDIIWFIGDNNKEAGAFSHRFKLVEQETKSMNKIKVGDWVKIKPEEKEYHHDILLDKAYQVFKINPYNSEGPDFIWIKDEVEEYNYNPRYFELAAAPAPKVKYSPGQVVNILKEIKFCNGYYFNPGDKIDVTELNEAYFNNSDKQDCYELKTVEPEIVLTVGQKYRHYSGEIYMIITLEAKFGLICIDSKEYQGKGYSSRLFNTIEEVFSCGREYFTLVKE